MSMDPAAGTRTGISSCGVVGAGAAAGKVPMAAAAVARGLVVVLAPVPVAVASPAGAAAAAKPALNWKNLRRRWAQTLFVLGCAAAALAFFSINSSFPTATADSRGLLGSCAPTDAAEAASLRTASEHLLVFAAAQALAATTALLVPSARQVAVFLSIVAYQTGYRAAGVLLKLFECHGAADAVVVTSYCILEVVAFVGYFVGSVVIVNSSY